MAFELNGPVFLILMTVGILNVCVAVLVLWYYTRSESLRQYSALDTNDGISRESVRLYSRLGPNQCV